MDLAEHVLRLQQSRTSEGAAMIERAIHWIFTVHESVLLIGFIIVYVVIAGGWSLVLSWLDRRHDESWDEGFNTGYARGRRDERAETTHDAGDAHYPMITETLPDGSKRRLDR